MLAASVIASMRRIVTGELRQTAALFRKSNVDDGFGVKTEALVAVATLRCTVQYIERLPVTPTGGDKQKFVSTWLVVFAFGVDVRTGDILQVANAAGGTDRFELDGAYNSDLGAPSNKFYAFKVV